MNPRAATHSAPDVVLLFESTGGWNQSGGAELLTTKHHEGKGCNVLFVGGAGGDIVTGGATVILAMGAGRKAAASIHEFLTAGVWEKSRD